MWSVRSCQTLLWSGFMRHNSVPWLPIAPVLLHSSTMSYSRRYNVRLRTRQMLLSRVSSVRSFHQSGFTDSVFDSVKNAETNSVNVSDLLELITKAGISLDDPRLSDLMMKLRNLHKVKSNQKLMLTRSVHLDKDTFKSVTQGNISMLVRVVMDDFCIPHFQEFGQTIEEIYQICEENQQGSQADYIPQLAQVDPSLWGVSVCTVDGQRFSVGDHEAQFTLQSTSKPLTYALALTELGPELVHQSVGYEPSGKAFNHIMLNPHNRPHNPLINSGALAICSIIQPHLSPPERFQYLDKMFTELSGGQEVGFNNSIFLSERSTAHRNYAIAHYMKENHCFDDHVDLPSLVDFYLQVCSIEANCDSLSVMASTLANGGVNPLTGDRLITTAAARDTLSVMHSCGMYDYSGQFAFKELVRRFVFHHYESQLHTDKKTDPRKPRDSQRASAVTAILFAAESNDCATLRRCYISGYDVKAVDYDGRSGLHVAASSGSLEAVKFFVELGNLDPHSKDRWGHTPLSEAERFNHIAICEYLHRITKQKENEQEAPEK